MSLELPAKADLNSTPTVTEYKAAIGSVHDFIKSGFFDPVTGGGAANIQTATLTETGGYKTGRIYRMKPGFTNSGAYTVNFDGLGAKNGKLIDGSTPYAGAITAGIPADHLYDGTNMVLLNPCLPDAKLNTAGKFVTGSFSKSSVANNSFASVESITHGLGTDEVSLEVCVSTFGSGTPGMWSLQWYGPGRRGTTIIGPSGFTLTLGDRTPPASGTIDIYLHNNSSNTRSYTIAYKISALA